MIEQYDGARLSKISEETCEGDIKAMRRAVGKDQPNPNSFRVWNKQEERWLQPCDVRKDGDGVLWLRKALYDSSAVICRYDWVTPKDTARYIECPYTGIQDKDGEPLHDYDRVYLAGYGVYICEAPYFELYEALAENDIGKRLGSSLEQTEEG